MARALQLRNAVRIELAALALVVGCSNDEVLLGKDRTSNEPHAYEVARPEPAKQIADGGTGGAFNVPTLIGVAARAVPARCSRGDRFHDAPRAQISDLGA